MPLSRLATDTRFASWPIKAPNGIDVTLDTVQVGFTTDRNDTPTAWYNAQIVVDATRYSDSAPRIRVLIGPENNGVTPGRGPWHIHAKVSDDPEVPVIYLDYIVIR